MLVPLLLTAASVLLFLALWVVAPAPNMALLVLGVGVPELSPALLGVSIVVSVLLGALGGGYARTFGCCMSVVAALLLSVPLFQLPASIRRFDEALSSAGVASPASRLTAMRSAPFSVGDLLSGIHHAEVHEAHGVVVATVGGVTLTADVYRPPSGGHYPVLVQIYGGAWQRGQPSDDGAFARYFAARGYVVCAIDYRHAPTWQWPVQGEDVATALAWLVAHAAEYGGDAKRIALVGRSAGGQLALRAAYGPGPVRVAGVVAFYAPTNLTEGWRMPPVPDPLPVRPTLEAYLGGTPDERPDRYRDASPFTHVSSAAPPTLLLYGSRDHIVEAHFGREIDRRLRDVGATSVLLELPWAEHAFDTAPRGLGQQVSWYYVERFLAWALDAERRDAVHLRSS